LEEKIKLQEKLEAEEKLKAEEKNKKDREKLFSFKESSQENSKVNSIKSNTINEIPEKLNEKSINAEDDKNVKEEITQNEFHLKRRLRILQNVAIKTVEERKVNREEFLKRQNKANQNADNDIEKTKELNDIRLNTDNIKKLKVLKYFSPDFKEKDDNLDNFDKIDKFDKIEKKEKIERPKAIPPTPTNSEKFYGKYLNSNSDENYPFKPKKDKDKIRKFSLASSKNKKPFDDKNDRIVDDNQKATKPPKIFKNLSSNNSEISEYKLDNDLLETKLDNDEFINLPKNSNANSKKHHKEKSTSIKNNNNIDK